MPYVYSTLTNNNSFMDYEKSQPGAPLVVKRSVTIKGGTGIANKHLFTPMGVATEVSEEDLDFLKANDGFRHFVDKGFITYREKEVHPEVAASDMDTRDQSTPVMPQDFREQDAAKPSENDQPGVMRKGGQKTEDNIDKFKKAFKR